jgi:hypothetical protein
MKKCGEPVKAAQNGASRGVCTRPAVHTGLHSNKTCSVCGVILTTENTHRHSQSTKRAMCKECKNKCANAWYYKDHNKNLKKDKARRRKNGQRPRIVPNAGNSYTFSCGCSGVLPSTRGKSNKFARWNSHTWTCRVKGILQASVNAAAASRDGYVSINPKTPHSVIRELMKADSCWRCKRPLKWSLGMGKTPHLHHNHWTGELYGFTHSRCNPKALEHENDELRERIRELEECNRELESELAYRKLVA